METSPATPVPRKGAPAKRQTFRALFSIYRFAAPYWPLIALALVSMAAFAAAEGYYLYLVKPFIDALTSLLKKKQGVAPEVDFDRLYEVGKRALLLAPAVGVLAFGKEFFSGRIIWKLVADIRNAICTALLPQSLGFFEDRRSGDLMSRITNDVGRTQIAFRLLFAGIPEQVCHIIMGTTIAVIYGREFILGALVVVPIVLVPVAYLAARIRRYGKEGLQKLSDLTDLMSQMFSGIRVIKAFKMEDAEAQEFQHVNRKFLGKMLKIVKIRGLSAGSLELILRGFIGVAIIAATWLVARKEIHRSPGDLLICIGGAYYAFHAVKKLVKVYNRLQETVPAADRIIELIQHQPELQDAPNARPVEHIAHSIACRNVSFGYNEEKVLHDVSFEVKPGERVAIVGKSGAGKSTLVALIMRFYDVSSGAVTFDGVDVREVTRDSLLDRIAIVTQQTFLFNRSIADNIRYGRRDASQHDVEAAAKLAHIHDFITSLPQGYDMLCGEFGLKLSGGQRQRIAIARALLKDADILILDEAMVGLDSESEALVREALGNLMSGRTTFILTHDLATIRNADRILVLRDGRLIAQGTHDRLMADCEEYRNLYILQA